MPIRLGPGPVFVYEWLTSARRWQTYALRVLFVGAILIGLAFVWYQMTSYRQVREMVSIAELASYGQSIYLTIATIELSLILLAAPAATAGAVCLDKARGTLDHMLATDLSNAEIVLGKLGVRLVPVLGLVACVFPVVALSGLLGGIDPLALAGSFLVAIGCAVVGCSLAMTLSVWARKTHEVVMMTYMLLLLWLILPGLVALVMYYVGTRPPPAAAPAFWQVVIDSNPYYLVYAPYTNPADVDLTTFLAFLGACLATSAGLVGLATVRVRRVALRQAGRPAAARRGRLAWLFRRRSRLPRIPGPSLDVNPVAWREWHRTRPSWMMRIAWGLYAALGLLWFVMLLCRPPEQRVSSEGVAFANAFQVAVGLLLLSVGAATSLAEERARGSLDVLMATPMSTRAILAGKWWGTSGQIKPVLFWPALTSLLLLHAGGSLPGYFLMIGVILAQGAAITSLGLALATWVGRPGRAIALCVATYVVSSIGWPILVAVLVRGEPLLPCLLFGTPAIGAFVATETMGPPVFPWQDRDEYGAAVTIWMVVDLLAAAALFAATVSSFDSCLGRIPEAGEPPPRRVKKTTPFPELP